MRTKEAHPRKSSKKESPDLKRRGIGRQRTGGHPYLHSKSKRKKSRPNWEEDAAVDEKALHEGNCNEAKKGRSGRTEKPMRQAN